MRPGFVDDATFGEIEERGGALNVRNYCNWRKAVQGFRRRVTFDQVLAVSTDDGLKAGADVAGATVTASVVTTGRAKKVIVAKYKRKTGYHKKNGHRQYFTQVKIDKINA